MSPLNLLAQSETIVKRPLLPPLVHDDTTRTIVCLVVIVISLIILYRVGKSLNE